ncbi:hypothetical protein EJB05_29992, partial [Eragrostis curvula]
MESLWDRLPRGIVKELTRGGFKRGDALPQELVDHFEELDRLTGRNALVEVPAQLVPVAVVPPGVIIISDDEGPDELSAKPSQCSGVASRTRSISSLITSYGLIFRHSQAFCRFDHAVSSIDKARTKDPRNTEVITMHNKVKAVARARSLGNELFNSGKFSEACLAYGQGLKQHPTNKIMYGNRAACWFKLGQWEKSVEDCNKALKIHPNYTKALLRRAACYGKMEQWPEIPTAQAQDHANLADGPKICANEALAHRCRCNTEDIDESSAEELCGAVSYAKANAMLIQVSNVWISSTGIVSLRGISFTSKQFSIERMRDDYKHLSRVLLVLISISGGDITKLPPDYEEFILLLRTSTLTVQDEFLIVNNSALLPMKNR